MKKHNLTLRTPLHLYEKIKKESEHIGVSVHELIIKTLNDKFN